MATSYTAALRKAQQNGHTVVCSMPPYTGRPVHYDPGYTGHHPRPWVLPGTGLRFSGRECHAEPPTNTTD